MLTKEARAFAKVGQLFKELNFADSGEQAVTDPEVVGYVTTVVRSMIKERNLVIGKITLNGDTFTGVAQTKVNPRLTKRFKFEISPDSKTFGAINLEEIEAFSEVVEFKGTRDGKTLNCSKTPPFTQCGGRCLKGKEKCRQDMSPEERKAHDKALKKVGTVDTSLAKKRREMKENRKGEKAPERRKPSQGRTSNVQQNDLASTLKHPREYTHLGSGIEAEVYLDKGPPKRALKYYSSAQSVDKSVFEGIRIGGELGIGPKLLGEAQVEAEGLKGRKQQVIAMEFLDGFTVGVRPAQESAKYDPKKEKQEQQTYNKSFLETLKKGHSNQYIFDDLHEENAMVNAKTKEIKFVDLGGLRKGTYEEMTLQLLDKYSPRPLSAEILDTHIKDKGDKKAAKEIQSLQRKILNRKDKPITEEEYKRMFDRVYELAEV